MAINYEPAPTGLPPVMLLDTRRSARFATIEARKLCEQWNEGLMDLDPGYRLPADLDSLLSLASRRGWDVSKTGVCVRHPRLPELSVTIRLGTAMPGVCVHDWYLLTFSTQAARSQAEDTLRQLSPGERRVALLVAQGLRNEEVAQRLQRSRRTVEYQLNVIFRKLDMTSRSQLVRALFVAPS